MSPKKDTISVGNTSEPTIDCQGTFVSFQGSNLYRNLQHIFPGLFFTIFPVSKNSLDLDFWVTTSDRRFDRIVLVVVLPPFRRQEVFFINTSIPGTLNNPFLYGCFNWMMNQTFTWEILWKSPNIHFKLVVWGSIIEYHWYIRPKIESGWIYSQVYPLSLSVFLEYHTVFDWNLLKTSLGDS